MKISFPVRSPTGDTLKVYFLIIKKLGSFMKKTLFHLSSTAFLSFFVLGGIMSCKVSEEIVLPVPVDSSFPVYYATIEQTDDSQTKVYVDNALHVLWNADDRLSIFPKYSRNYQYRFKGLDGASGGSFDKITPDGEYGTGTDIEYSYGVYPYNEYTDYIFDDKIRTFFPKEQYYRAGSFGLNANLMVAKSTSSDLSFKNVGSYLCLKIYGDGISVRSIILRGNGGETLSGPVKVSFGEGNIPSMTFDTDSPSELESEIVLKASTPVALGSSEAEAVMFWMVVPPIELPGGFTVTVIDSEGGIHEKKTTNPVSFVRNTQTVKKAFELVEETPASLSPGIYPLSGEEYVYEKTTDQINIYEAEGNAWARFLLIPNLTMYEIGPIPADATAGTTFTATVSSYVEGAETLTIEDCSLTVQSIESGIMTLVSDEGVRYVFRF